MAKVHMPGTQQLKIIVSYKYDVIRDAVQECYCGVNCSKAGVGQRWGRIPEEGVKLKLKQQVGAYSKSPSDVQ